MITMIMILMTIMMVKMIIIIIILVTMLMILTKMWIIAIVNRFGHGNLSEIEFEFLNEVVT